MKIFGKIQKSHYDVIVTSLWRHKAIFRTLLWNVKNFFLFNQISPNFIKVIIISWNYFLRVLVIVEKIDVIWRQKTWKWPFLAYFGPQIMLNVIKFIKSVANVHLRTKWGVNCQIWATGSRVIRFYSFVMSRFRGLPITGKWRHGVKFCPDNWTFYFFCLKVIVIRSATNYRKIDFGNLWLFPGGGSLWPPHVSPKIFDKIGAMIGRIGIFSRKCA